MIANVKEPSTYRSAALEHFWVPTNLKIKPTPSVESETSSPPTPEEQG